MITQRPRDPDQTSRPLSASPRLCVRVAGAKTMGVLAGAADVAGVDLGMLLGALRLTRDTVPAHVAEDLIECISGLPIELGVVSTTARPRRQVGCGHTDREHRAFDGGVAAGREGRSEVACPYTSHHLREAWMTGHSVGVLDRAAVAVPVEGRR